MTVIVLLQSQWQLKAVPFKQIPVRQNLFCRSISDYSAFIPDGVRL